MAADVAILSDLCIGQYSKLYALCALRILRKLNYVVEGERMGGDKGY